MRGETTAWEPLPGLYGRNRAYSDSSFLRALKLGFRD